MTESHTLHFKTKSLQLLPDVIAPDGFEVRVLLALQGGSMAHFELAPGQVSTAIKHKTVEEIWFILAGEGQMWRQMDDDEDIVHLNAGMCLTIPLGTQFQFRTMGTKPLQALGVTMPPWPGEDEAVVVTGIWHATVP